MPETAVKFDSKGIKSMPVNIIITLTIAALLSGCASMGPAPSATPNGPRTIILDGEQISESLDRKFITWRCADFIDDWGPTLVEVGIIPSTEFDIKGIGLGFVLFDNGYIGRKAIYHRDGLVHTWIWGDDFSYQFNIKTDSTGLFYDFGGAEGGEVRKPREIFKCYKR